MCCYQSSSALGSNPSGTGMSQCAMDLDALLIVSFEILIYLLKQSLDHLPIPCIKYLGHPIAAAVDAAPIRREWDDTLAAPLVMSFSKVFMSALVKNPPF